MGRSFGLLVLFLLVALAPLQIPAAVFPNSVSDLVAGDVYPVPVNSATNQGSIDLPTPNGNEEYELMLYSLNPYHQHNRITYDPSDYPEGLFNFKVSVDALNNASITGIPAALRSIPGATNIGREPKLETMSSFVASPAERSAGETRIFRIDQGRKMINATLWRVSEISYVYVDNTTPAKDFNATDVEYLGRLFDETIFPKETGPFGSPAPNPDNDQHVVIVFSPYLNAGLADDFDTPHGYNTNHRNILFLYTPDPEGEYGDYVKGIPKETVVKENLPHRIAHVLNHLLNWTQHIDLRNGPNEYLGMWEGLANLAEYVALGNAGLTEPRYCITYFLRKPEIFSVLDRTTGYYGAHTAFVWYLYEVYGAEAIKRLSQTGQVGPDNVEAATGQDFAQIFRDWSAAMFLSNTDLNLDQRYQLGILNMRSLRSRGPSETQLTVGDQIGGQLRSTGVDYFRLKASPKSRALAVRFEGQSGSQLQASVIRLPTVFNIIADIPPNAYAVNGILLDSIIPGQLVLGQMLSLSGSVNDARAEQVFLGVGPQDGPTFWQNNGRAIWWALAPVNEGRFSLRVAFGVPDEWCGQRLELGDYRLSITYEYANYAHWGAENSFPSIRILSKAPTLTTTTISATTSTTRETATQVTAISTSTETGSTPGTEATTAQPSARPFTTETLMIAGIAFIVIVAVGVYYVQKRRK